MSLAINKTVQPIIYRWNIVMANNLRSNIQRGYYYYGWMIIRIHVIRYERERVPKGTYEDQRGKQDIMRKEKRHPKIEVKTFHQNLRK